MLNLEFFNFLFTEAQKIEQINLAEARALGLEIVGKMYVNFKFAIISSDFISTFYLNRLLQPEGKNAASLMVAEKYVNAFNELARTNNTLILPSNVSDVSSLVGQAMSVYSTISKNTTIASAQFSQNADAKITEKKISSTDESTKTTDS